MTTEEYFERKKRESEGKRTLRDVQIDERAAFISRLENLDKLSTEVNSVYDAYKSRYFDANGNYKNTYLGDTDDAYNTFNEFKSKFDTESQEILSSFDKYSHLFSDDYVKSTKDWLTNWGENLNNMHSAYLGERYRYDSEKGQKELEEKEKLYEAVRPYKEIFDYGVPDIGDDHLIEELGLKTGSSKETYEWNTAIAKKKLKELGFTPEEVDELYSELAERKKYHKDAVRLQTEANFDNVGNSESDVYDPNFNKYVEKGNAIPYVEVGEKKRHRAPGGKGRVSAISIDSERAAALALYEYNGGEIPLEYRHNQDVINLYRNFEDDEFKALAYWMGYDEANGTNKTAEYLTAKENTLNARMGQDIYDKVEDSVALELAFGVVAGLDQFASGMVNVFNTKDDYIAPSSIQYASGMIREDLEDAGFEILGNSVGQIGYDFITTITNMLPSIGISAAVGLVNQPAGAVLGASLMGASSAGNAYADMVNAGYTKDQARTYSTLVGVSEAGLQYALGGISKLGGNVVSKFTSKTLGGIAKGINNASIQFAVEYGGQFASKIVSEGIEEGLQEVLDPFFRSIATGEKPQGVDWEQVAYSGMLGALSAGVLEGGDSIATRVSEIDKARTIKNEGNVETLKNVGMSFSADSVAYKIADKVTEKTGAYKLSMLLHDVNANLSEQNVQDIETALVEKGIASENAKSIAKWLGKAVDGGKLTKAQQMALEDNPVISQVFREVIVDKNSTVNRRLQGLMDLNGIERQAGVDLAALEEYKPTAQSLSDKINFDNALKQMADITARQQYGIRTISKSNQAAINDAVNSALNGMVSEENGVSVKKVSEISKNGTMMVETNDGTVEDSNNIKYKSREEAALYISTANLASQLNNLGIGFDANAANAVISAFAPGMNNIPAKSPSGLTIDDYIMGVKEAIRYGAIGQKQNTIRKDGAYGELTKSQRDYFYNLGRELANRTTSKEENAKAITNENSNAKQTKNGKVTKVIKSKLKLSQSTAVSTIEKLSEVGILKNNFYIFESEAKEKIIDGKSVQVRVFSWDIGDYKSGDYAPNGIYQTATGDIYVDINSGINGQGLTLYTLAHELGHFVKAENADGFEILADFVADELGGEFENLIKKKLEMWNRLGRTGLDYMDAREDVICDALEPMFTEGNLAQRLIKYSNTVKEGKGLINTLRKFFSNLYARIQKAYAKLDYDDPAAKVIAKNKKAVGEIADLFAKTLVETTENFDNADVQAQKNTTSEGDVKTSLRESVDGNLFVDVDNIVVSENSSAKDISNILSKIVKENFSELIEANGQKIGINQKTASEWQSSKNARYLRKNDSQIYFDKMNSLNNADELLKASREYVGEEIKHIRKDSFVEFARGVVDFKVGDRGYSADIIVGTTKSGAAVLYDIVNIAYKKIESASNTAQDRRSDTLSTNSINQNDSSVNTYSMQESKNNSENHSDRNYSYNELVSKPDLKGIVISKSQQVKLLADGSIDVDWVVSEVRKKCKHLDSKLSNYYVEVPDIGRNVDITYKGIQHGFIKNSNKGNKSVSDKALLNARVSLELPQVLSNSIEVNRSARKGNIDIPYAHILIGTVGLEDASGNVEYYAVRSVVEERANLNPILIEAEILGKLKGINAKKIDSPRIRGTAKNSVALPHSVAYTYKIADLLDDVKGIFDDTFSQDVYNHFKMSRNESDFSKNLLYSDRNFYLSSRNLLANALESTAKNDVEREWLGRYKEQIQSLNEDQKRLDEINAEIKEISFSKGTDRRRLTVLNNNKKTLTARITRADKKLLQLEAAKPLKRVLEVEKKRAQQKANERAKQIVISERERSSRRERELKDKYTGIIDRKKEGRDKTAIRNKIKKVVKDLNKILNRGTRERNVKIGLQDAVGKALATAEILFSDEITNADIARLGVESVTDKEMEYLSKYNELLDQLDSASEEEIPNIKAKISRYNSLLKDVFIRERARLNRQTVDYALDSLAEAYKDLRNSTDDYIKENSYVENIYDRIIGLKNDIKGVTIKDMSLEQLESVYEIYSMVMHMVSKANSIFRDGRYEDLDANISDTQAEFGAVPSSNEDSLDIIEKVKDLGRSFLWNELKPYDAFERLGSKTFERLFWDVVEADGIWARDMEEAARVIEESRKKYGYKMWDMKTAKVFKSANGLDFKLTLGDMMSIYAYSKRPQAEGHMTVGGFVFDQGSTYKVKNDEKKKGLFKTYRHVKTSKTYRVDPKLISDVIAELNKIDGVKEYVDEIQSYLTKLGEKGNEVSRIMYGTDLFKEKVYFPLQSAQDYRSSVEQTLNATQTMASLKNTGISKETVPNANNPIVLRSFDDVVLEHINTMSKYHAYVIPIENLSKVFNNVGKSAINGEYISTKALISSKFGNSATKYFDQFITDLNGGSFSGGASNPLAKLFGTAKSVSVAANLSVLVQQYFAVIRAMDMLSPKYMVPFLNSEAGKSTKKQWEELKKYAPVGIIKEIGGFDMGANRSAIDYIGNAETKMDAKKLGKKVKEGTMRLADKMDEIGWSTIWRAVKKEIADTTTLDIGTEEFFQACGKRFTEIIVKTQVYDSVTSRSGYMRSKRESVKYLTSFLGEPTTIVNMMLSKQMKLARAIKSKDKTAIKEASLGLLRTSTVVILSTVLTSLAKSLPYAMRDDEEEEGALLERWAKHFGESVASDMNPLSMLPVGRDLVSIWEGWDVERPDMTLISDIFTAFKRAVDDGCETDEALALAGALANILGYPLKNILRDVKGFIRLFGDVTDGVSPEDIGGAFAEGFTD